MKNLIEYPAYILTRMVQTFRHVAFNLPEGITQKDLNDFVMIDSHYRNGKHSATMEFKGKKYLIQVQQLKEEEGLTFKQLMEAIDG